MNIRKIAGITTALACLVSPLQVSALGSAAFISSPSASYVTVNDTVTFTVYENGSNVRGVTLCYSYDSSKLQLMAVDTNGSVFTQGFTSGNCVQRYITPGDTATVANGNVKVASFSFKAIGSGSATFAAGANGSSISSDGTSEQWNGATSSSTVTVAGAPVKPANPVATPTPTAAASKPAATTSVVTSPTAATATSTVETKDDKSDVKAATATNDSSDSGTTLSVATANDTSVDDTIRNAVLSGLAVLLAGLVALRYIQKRQMQEATVAPTKPAAKKRASAKS